MKKFNHLKHFIAVIALLLISMEVFSQPVTTIANITNNPTGVYYVPVTVSNFNNIGSFTLKISFDPAILSYGGITLNSGIIFKSVVDASDGQSVTVTYTPNPNDPAIVLSGPTLFTIQLLANADPNTGSILASSLNKLVPLTWSTKTYSQPNGFVLTNAVFNNGSIFIPLVPTISTPVQTTSGLFNQDISVFPVAATPGLTMDFYTEPNKTAYHWTVSDPTAIITGGNSNHITLKWGNITGQQTLSVTYKLSPTVTVSMPSPDIINYYPFATNIDPTTIPQFAEPMPHFAGGLRVNAKTVSNLVVEAVPVQQITLTRGTMVKDAQGVSHPIDGISNYGKGNYAGYKVSTDGKTFGPAMWPAQTIETMQGHPLTVQYINGMVGAKYSDFNILADQTLMENGFTLNGNKLTDPYTGDIPMSVHLHGGEMPSNSDGGPTAWFMPIGNDLKGPGFADEASSLCYYPNAQEGTTLWYHPHDQGLTRINVYTGLAGYYFLRGKNEDAMKLPGWSGDDKVVEVQPTDQVTDATGTHPRFAPFYAATPQTAVPYLPEVELAIQDRMFNEKGELYWPVTPTNPDVHPFWTPEFFGDVMTVNGKSWPYLSVAKRKYMFRMLDGCNARFLNLWLEDMSHSVTPPKITVISTEGGFLQTPVDLIQSNTLENRQTLFLAPAERPMVIIDFSNVPVGTVFTLRNDANAPYPTGSPVTEGLTDRIMQFVVNGTLVKADGSKNGSDKSLPSGYVRPTPLVQLTDFTTGKEYVTPVVKRQLLLNEITGPGGPIMVAINNSHFDSKSPLETSVADFGALEESPTEGTIEEWKILNTTTDAHPMHIHLTQWQLVSRQLFNKDAYMADYATAFKKNHPEIPNYPDFSIYPGGAGSPFDYSTPNKDGAIGGNPAISDYLLPGTITYPLPEERGWKDAIKALPGSDLLGIGQVSTYLCRLTPTDLPVNTTDKSKLVYPFDPSFGPGYVWHCHIIDHEDMDMMRPLTIIPSPLRFPLITGQPADVLACVGDNVTFSVNAARNVINNYLVGHLYQIGYQWQGSIDGGKTWKDINPTDFPGHTNFNTARLSVNPATIGFSTYKYRCRVANMEDSQLDGDEQVLSNVATLTVNNCTISGYLKYNNPNYDKLAGMTVKTSINNKSDVVDNQGNYKITGVISGIHSISVTPGSTFAVGGVNATDAGAVNYWYTHVSTIPIVKFLSGDVNANGPLGPADVTNILNNFVKGQSFNRTPWTFWDASKTTSVNSNAQPTDPLKVTVAGKSVTLNLLGQVTGDFNSSFNPLDKSPKSSMSLTYGDVIMVKAGQYIELPISIDKTSTVGAISLILNFPSDLIDVTNVYLKNNPYGDVTYNEKGNELRIGWSSLNSVSVHAGDDFIILKLHILDKFTYGKTAKLTLVANPLNEFATGSFVPIQNVVINVNVLTGVANNPLVVAMVAVPNPFRDIVTINYSISNDAFVTLKIYNLLGVAVKTLVNNQYQQNGSYTSRWDASNMRAGTYYSTIHVDDGKTVVEKTVKIILNN